MAQFRSCPRSYRATVGFDQIADLIDRVLASGVGQSSYPP